MSCKGGWNLEDRDKNRVLARLFFWRSFAVRFNVTI